MSMTGEYLRLTSWQLEDFLVHLRDDPYALENYLDHDARRFEPPDLHLSIGKAWAGLHFLLNGSQDEIFSPAGSIVHGGRGMGADLAYGPVRVLTPDQVKAISDDLKTITEEWFLSRFDPNTFGKANIYPGGDWHDPQSGTWLWGEFCNVRDFFQDAADFSDAMLLYIA